MNSSAEKYSKIEASFKRAGREAEKHDISIQFIRQHPSADTLRRRASKKKTSAEPSQPKRQISDRADRHRRPGKISPLFRHTGKSRRGLSEKSDGPGMDQRTADRCGRSLQKRKRTERIQRYRRTLCGKSRHYRSAESRLLQFF